MTDLRCPLCEATLAVPSGTTKPQSDTDVLEAHFAECPAISLPRAVARTPEPRHDKRHDGKDDR